MAGEKLKAPRGTFDVLPDDGSAGALRALAADDLLGAAGYGIVDTPIFESTELFARGVGETTDIVQKEMFTFEDQGGRSLTLRPEGTASVVRAYLEHGMHKLPQPVKLRYYGPFFRHEAPQAGRYRQFTQIGAEAIGSDDPSLDAEVILLLHQLLEGARGVRLRIGSLGTPETRREYSDELRELPGEHEVGAVGRGPRARIDATRCGRSTPTTGHAAGDGGRRRGCSTASTPTTPSTSPRSARCSTPQVRPYEVDPTLVRGLDYYTRTVFEFTSDALGAQSGVAGGGRYDLLAEQLGGPHVPGVGFAAGVERILLAGDHAACRHAGDVFIACEGDVERRVMFGLLNDLRRQRLRADMEQAGRSIKGQFKQADRLGAAKVVIVTPDEVRVRDMETGETREVSTADEARALL